MLNVAILVAFQHISVSFKNNWGSTTIALFLPEMCFVSYMLFSACGHVGACRSGLFVEAMFLDIAKLNTRLNSISMLKCFSLMSMERSEFKRMWSCWFP